MYRIKSKPTLFMCTHWTGNSWLFSIQTNYHSLYSTVLIISHCFHYLFNVLTNTADTACIVMTTFPPEEKSHMRERRREMGSVTQVARKYLRGGSTHKYLESILVYHHVNRWLSTQSHQRGDWIVFICSIWNGITWGLHDDLLDNK